jgi:GDP-D-mannose dehydratase
MKKALITGVTGQGGSYLDLLDVTSLIEALKIAYPDEVYNCLTE